MQLETPEENISDQNNRICNADKGNMEAGDKQETENKLLVDQKLSKVQDDMKVLIATMAAEAEGMKTELNGSQDRDAKAEVEEYKEEQGEVDESCQQQQQQEEDEEEDEEEDDDDDDDDDEDDDEEKGQEGDEESEGGKDSEVAGEDNDSSRTPIAEDEASVISSCVSAATSTSKQAAEGLVGSVPLATTFSHLSAMADSVLLAATPTNSSLAPDRAPLIASLTSSSLAAPRAPPPSLASSVTSQPSSAVSMGSTARSLGAALETEARAPLVLPPLPPQPAQPAPSRPRGAACALRGGVLWALVARPTARAVVWVGRLLAAAALLHFAGVEKAAVALDALGPRGIAVLACLLFALWLQEVFGVIFMADRTTEESAAVSQETTCSFPTTEESMNTLMNTVASKDVDDQLEKDIQFSKEKLKKVEYYADDLLRIALNLSHIVSPARASAAIAKMNIKTSDN